MNQNSLNLPPLDNPEGYLTVNIAGREPILIPYMDYVTVDQITEILELQDGLQNASTPKESMAATVALLSALGLNIVNILPAGHLMKIMEAWQQGPGDLGESDGSRTFLEPTELQSSTSSSATVSGSEISDDLLDLEAEDDPA